MHRRGHMVAMATSMNRSRMIWLLACGLAAGVLAAVWVCASRTRFDALSFLSLVKDGVVLDLGIVPIGLEPDGTRLVQLLTIRNDSGKSIQIRRSFVSCGCTSVEYPAASISPGNEFVVEITLSVATSGLVSATATLDFSEKGMATISLSAVGRSDRELIAVPNAVKLASDEVCVITLYATNRNSDDSPEWPQFKLPLGISASFSGWNLLYARDRLSDLPARWEGTMHIRGKLSESASLEEVIALVAGQEAKVRLTR